MVPAPESSLHFEALVALAAVARHGSVQAAAAAIGLSAPRLNRLLRMQEQRLGIALVEASARGMTLTDAGERLHRHAQALLHAVADAETSARQEHRGLDGTLRVQAPQALLVPLVVPLVLRLQDAHPALRIQLLTDEHPSLIDAPPHLRLMPGPLPPSLYARPVGALRIGLFASPGYLSRTGHPQNLNDLAGHALIHCPREGQAPTWQLAGGHCLRFEPRLSVTTSAAAVRAAIEGAGIVRCYDPEAHNACAQGLLEPVAEFLWPPPQPLALTYHLGLRAPASVRAFLDLATPWLRDQLTG